MKPKKKIKVKQKAGKVSLKIKLKGPSALKAIKKIGMPQRPRGEF